MADKMQDSTLCGFGFSFPAPLREALFLAKAQREDVRRKGLSLPSNAQSED
jgi:hypothetical protein